MARKSNAKLRRDAERATVTRAIRASRGVPDALVVRVSPRLNGIVRASRVELSAALAIG